jgi:carbon-monoxide dehydrogenase medium subunit
MNFWNQYLQPQTVDEALKLLAGWQGSTAIVAGGTDLLLDLQQGRHAPVEALIDITLIDEMSGIRLEADHIFLGAATTHREIIQNNLLEQHCNVLVEGCGLIGGPQVRNVATIGGNVAHALPAGDGTISLLALEAQAQLASPNGRRWLPVEVLFAGPGETTFDRGRELMVGFKLPLRGRNEGSAFRRIMRPQGVAIAILNMGAWVQLSPDGSLSQVRLAVGPAGPRPLRAHQTEAQLRGLKPDQQAIQDATATLLEEVQLRTSKHRATREYRVHLIAVLLERTLRAAVQQARTA